SCGRWPRESRSRYLLHQVSAAIATGWFTPLDDFEMWAHLHSPSRRLPRSLSELHDWQHVRAPKQPHHGTRFFECLIAEQGAVGVVRECVPGTRHRVHHVDHVAIRPRRSWIASEIKLPLRDWNCTVQQFRIGKRLLRLVLRLLVLPPPQYSAVA